MGVFVCCVHFDDAVNPFHLSSREMHFSLQMFEVL